MATDTTETSTDTGESILERIGDSFGVFSERAVTFITRLFGSSNERFVKRLGLIASKDPKQPNRIIPGSVLDQVNSLEPQMKKLSDEELKALTPKFRERLAKGETLDDLLPEAFAACREAAFRTKNMRHFDVQIVGGVVLHRGNISEMVTGEGKTLVATLPAYLNALEQGGVHVITVNDYLARRDCEWMLPIYNALGVTAGYIQADMEPDLRRKAYDCDITYGTNSEFGFDYLRDNMKPARRGDNMFNPWAQQVQRMPLNFAIIDEVDNILIDEARTPLIISGPAFTDVMKYGKANDVAVQLGDLQRQEPGKYFEIKEKEHTCHLTDEGIRKAEELAGVESFYTAGNMDWPHMIDNALKAHHLYKRDRNYMIMADRDNPRDLAIIIIDEFTGRPMFGRQWSDGLHQAVEAKHQRDGVKIKQETQTLATITLQNFFKLYKKLAGMTGTAMTEANEFWKIYHLEVVAIPTNKSLIRNNSPDRIYRSETEKWNAVLEEIVEINGSGRPLLIGTTDVAKSEKLSGMLGRRGIKHELLNAKPELVGREAEIIAQAGRIGAVTISTNMAGRGTDIILGGNPETLAWASLRHQYPTRLDVPNEIWTKTVNDIESKEKMKEEGRKVAEMGGLHVLGTERHESRRIDNQLRGRAGRQGDPGSSRFYLSLEDDLMRIFAGDWVKGILTRLGMQEGEAIESSMVSRQVQKAQKRVEERNFDIRKNLLEYDEVMDVQRKYIYGLRQRILDGTNCKAVLLEMIDRQIDEAVDRYLDEEFGPSSFAQFASNQLNIDLDASDFYRCSYEEAERVAIEKAQRQAPAFIEESLQECLNPDEDPKEWKWQELSRRMNVRYGLKTTDKELKVIAREELSQFFLDRANDSIQKIDLKDGAKYLNEEWNIRSLCDWVKQKFLLKVTPEELKGKEAPEMKEMLREKVLEAYRQRELEFPVTVAMANYMAEQRTAHGAQQKYDRAGLYAWSNLRFREQSARVPEEEFRTLSRNRLFEMLLGFSKETFPSVTHFEIDKKLDEAFAGTSVAEAEDAKELVGWAKETLNLEIAQELLTGKTQIQARQVLWNHYDLKYRPEMRGMERSLYLNQLDEAWKRHLLTMDHLRSTVGLAGFAQEDPKIVYKREGMKAFEVMKDAMEDRVTDSLFRMEEEEGFRESVWAIGAAVHETFQASQTYADAEQQTSTNAPQSEKKKEPIRRKEERVGRNDPCPCGSGKKYKNCHMRSSSPR
jgi:preprotein translocase subunit SecA